MLEEINKHPTFLKWFNLKVIWQDGQCSRDVGAKLFMENLLHDRYTVFAPGISVGDLDADHDGAITTSETAQFNQTWGTAEVFPGVVGSQISLPKPLPAPSIGPQTCPSTPATPGR